MLNLQVITICLSVPSLAGFDGVGQPSDCSRSRTVVEQHSAGTCCCRLIVEYLLRLNDFTNQNLPEGNGFRIKLSDT